MLELNQQSSDSACDALPTELKCLSNSETISKCQGYNPGGSNSPISGDNLAALATNFDAQGYWTIDQLTSGRISIKNLSSWMNIGKGTANYIIQYADEDMVLTNDGKLTMADLPNVDNSDDGSL